MKKIKVAVVGYGNIGKYALEALCAAPDFEVAGIVRRDATNVPEELAGYKVVDFIDKLDDVDVAILCCPSGNAEAQARSILSRGINTVDSFDIHSEISGLRSRLGEVARQSNAVAIVAAGWDPGSDSVIRALFMACAPKGITYTDFGPGMSMGHSTAAKAIEGVKKALSMTIPAGNGIHRRMVYVQLENGADFEQVALAIKSDPYFANDKTHVIKTDDIDSLIDMGHGVMITRKGVSGQTHNQLFEFNMRVNNPALTAQIMVSSARAAMSQNPGAYTLIEIPLIDFLYGDRDELIESLV